MEQLVGDPRIKKWSVGDVTITRILEGEPLLLEPSAFLQTTREAVLSHSWLGGDFADEHGKLWVNIQTFIIEADGLRVLVDTCIGNHKVRKGAMYNMLDTLFLDRLQTAGYAPESIDVVLCTHLHIDHVGWNTRLVDGEWVPTFTNARYLFAERELRFSSEGHVGDGVEPYLDSVKPVVDAGLADLVEMDHVVSPSIRLEPTPGHTPGHCSIIISSGDETAIISGDVLHHPIQAADTSICSNFCFEPDKAVETRRALLRRASTDGSLFLGTHFPDPTGVRIVPDGSEWRVHAADPKR